MSTPKVSFVLPCFNYGRFLRDCIDSILAQQGEWNIEIVAVDDASTDDTWDILVSYGDRVRAFRHAANVGHIATVSEGLLASTGEYVARLDPDDRLRPDFLATTVALLDAHPEVGLVYGDVALIDDQGRQTQARCDTVHAGKAFKGNEFVALLGHNFICSPSVLARREAWISALPIPPDLAFHDWHLTTMIARRWEFCYVDKVIADYRVHSTNLHTAIARSGKEETSVLKVLDRYFSEVEANAGLESEKRGSRRRVYASQYCDFARKYFGSGQYANARRCYLAAARHRPGVLLSAEVLRHLFATVIGARLYEALKSIARRVAGRSAGTQRT